MLAICVGCCSEYVEDILSPDENSMNSSRISNKSEKNLADFDGEDVMSDEEIALINDRAAAAINTPAMLLQKRLSNISPMYVPPNKLTASGGLTAGLPVATTAPRGEWGSGPSRMGT
jgi:hypothetical protein